LRKPPMPWHNCFAAHRRKQLDSVETPIFSTPFLINRCSLLSKESHFEPGRTWRLLP
jgi:hypothetical protein